MPSSYTQNKGIEQPASGSYNSTWATPVNNDWEDIDNAFGGSATIDVTGVSAGIYTLTLAQYQPPNIIFTGAITGNLVYILPANVGGLWTIKNATSGGATLTFMAAGGGSVVLPQGQRTFVVTDGTNMEFAQSATNAANPTASVGLTAINGSAGTYMRSDAAPALNQGIAPTWTGVHIFKNEAAFYDDIVMATGSTFYGEAGTTLVATLPITDDSQNAASTAYVQDYAAPIASPVFTGVPKAPTASTGTNTTQLATTAFVQAALNAIRAGTSATGSITIGDTIINYGQHTCSGSSPDTVAYTTAYATEVNLVGIFPLGSGNFQAITLHTGFNSSLSNFTFDFAVGGVPVLWFAIGK